VPLFTNVVEGVFSEVRLLVSILATLVEGGFSTPREPSRERQVPEMAQGTVKWFSDEKGYGFITPDDGGEDLFVHHTGISGSGFKSLEEGQKVTYEATQGKKGMQAENVSKA
jgi:cold shock protein